MTLRPAITALAMLIAISLTACESGAPKKSAETKTTKKAVAAKKKPEKPKKEIVFDPRNPPPGYTNCHRNHCHKVGGGVASYAQVMAEMGATKIIGEPVTSHGTIAKLISTPIGTKKSRSDER